MRGLVAAGIVAAALLTSAASAAVTKPFTSSRTATCLAAHRVIANSAPVKTSVPPGIPAVAALDFTFALIPAQAVDHGSIVFERDPSAARRAAAAWLSYSLAQAARVQGIDQARARAILKAAFTVRGNAVVLWDNAHVKPASRRRIAGCLR